MPEMAQRCGSTVRRQTVQPQMFLNPTPAKETLVNFFSFLLCRIANPMIPVTFSFTGKAATSG